MEISPLNKVLLQISHLGYFELSDATQEILSDIEKLTPYHEEISLIKKVKELVQSGRIAKALTKLKELHSLPTLSFHPFQKIEKDDVLAFINYESALFYRIVYDSTAYINYLKITKLLAQSDEMNLLVDYQFATIEAEENSEINLLEDFADIFNKKELPVLEIMANFRMGEILAGKNQFNEAHDKFDEAEKIIHRIESEHLRVTCKSNRGFLYLLQSNYNEALQILTGITDCEDSFQKSLIFENIALVHEAMEDYETALTFWLQSLNICQDHGILMNIPEDTLHIGEIYENHLDSISQAKFFYKLGYEQSMMIFRDGINISRTMRAVIDKYISYFAEYYVPETKTRIRHAAISFSFALGKTWKEIMNVFCYNVIVYHKYHTRSVNEMLDRLSLKRSNFQAKQQKLAAAGFIIPDFRKNIHKHENMDVLDNLQGYIEYYKDLSWNDLCCKFENDVLKYIISHYGPKRENLIKRLNISYPNLKKKLDRISFR